MNNTTFKSLSLPDKVLVYILPMAGFIGLVTNGSLLFCFFLVKQLREKDYMIFIINRHVMGFLLCSSWLLLQPVGVMYWKVNPIWCEMAGSLLNLFGLTLFGLESLLSLNRFVSICHNVHSARIFTKRNIFFMSLLACLIGLLGSILGTIEGSYGRKAGFLCDIKLERTFLGLFSYIYIEFSVCYGIVGFCYFKVFIHLKKHEKQAQNNHELKSRLKEDKSILNYIKASAILPLLMQSPAALAFALSMADGSLTPEYFLFFACFNYLLYWMLDPVLTSVVVRPVRKEMKNLFQKIVSKENETGITTLFQRVFNKP